MLYKDRLAEAIRIKDSNIKTMQADDNTDALLRELEDDLKYITDMEAKTHV